MSVLVFLEHRGNELDRGALGVLSMAAALGAGPVAAVLAGNDRAALGSLATEAAKFGAAKVYIASDPMLDPPLPQPRVDVLADIVGAGGHDTVLFSTSVLSADVAAGLAARLDAGLNWDLTALEWRAGEPVGRRLALQDSVLVEVGWRSSHRIGVFRPGSFEAVSVNGGGGDTFSVTNVAVSLREHSLAVRIVSRTPVPETEGIAIDSAEVVVAGGMGLGAPEHFALVEQLAGVLGGAVGATRAVVYAGWYERGAQIGQTGRTVSPKLYLALGISGAIQHKVGMQSSKVIVAINKDPNAPIFECADLGVVGDLHTIGPRLVELLKQRKS